MTTTTISILITIMILLAAERGRFSLATDCLVTQEFTRSITIKTTTRATNHQKFAVKKCPKALWV